ETSSVVSHYRLPERRSHGRGCHQERSQGSVRRHHRALQHLQFHLPDAGYCRRRRIDPRQDPGRDQRFGTQGWQTLEGRGQRDSQGPYQQQCHAELQGGGRTQRDLLHRPIPGETAGNPHLQHPGENGRQDQHPQLQPGTVPRRM
ncbi:hypothetical protein, partial [Pseudomonas sp. FG-3G]